MMNFHFLFLCNECKFLVFAQHAKVDQYFELRLSMSKDVLMDKQNKSFFSEDVILSVCQLQTKSFLEKK